MAVEWTITIEGRNEFGDICRKAVRIDKIWERLFDGDLGLSIEDGNPRRVSGEFTRRQADGEETADAMVAPRRSHAHAGPDGRSERRASRSTAGTVPTARAERATTIQAQTASPARRLAPRKLPVSARLPGQ